MFLPKGIESNKCDSTSWCQELGNPRFQSLLVTILWICSNYSVQGLHFFFCIPLRLLILHVPSSCPLAIWVFSCQTWTSCLHTQREFKYFYGIAPMEFSYKGMKIRRPWKLGDLPSPLPLQIPGLYAHAIRRLERKTRKWAANTLGRNLVSPCGPWAPLRPGGPGIPVSPFSW